MKNEIIEEKKEYRRVDFKIVFFTDKDVMLTSNPDPTPDPLEDTDPNGWQP